MMTGRRFSNFAHSVAHGLRCEEQIKEDHSKGIIRHSESSCSVATETVGGQQQIEKTPVRPVFAFRPAVATGPSCERRASIHDLNINLRSLGMLKQLIVSWKHAFHKRTSQTAFRLFVWSADDCASNRNNPPVFSFVSDSVCRVALRLPHCLTLHH